MIVIFGEVLADVFADRMVLGGAPYNVARHLRAFQLQPLMLSKIGVDGLGKAILEDMHQLGLNTSGMQSDTLYPTGQVLVHLKENGDHAFEILPNQAYDHINIAAISDTLATRKTSLFYFGTLAQRNPESREAVHHIFHQEQVQLKFLDINLRAPWYEKETVEASLHHADILKLNHEELANIAELLGIAGIPPEIQVQELMKRFDLKGIIVTQGAEGAWHCDAFGSITTSEAYPMTERMVDTVGAGDAFSAVCMLGLIKKWPTKIMLDRANQFAAAICGVRGAVPTSLGFYTRVMRDWQLEL